MDPFLILIAHAPTIRLLGHAQDFMPEPEIEPEMPDGFLQVAHDLLAGGVQVRFKRPVEIGKMVLGIDVLQMDPGIGRCPYTADLFMLFEHNRSEPVFLKHTGSGDARDARTDDRDP